jgi:hypothetical protein
VRSPCVPRLIAAQVSEVRADTGTARSGSGQRDGMRTCRCPSERARARRT